MRENHFDIFVPSDLEFWHWNCSSWQE